MVRTGSSAHGANVHYRTSMQKQPLVSIIIPVRNEAAHLPVAFDAIAAQTYPAHQIQIIVVDGGSNDGTLELVRQRMATDPRIRLLGGPGVNTPLAMELGSRAAHGDLIAKVDGHGWINEEFLAAAVSEMQADPTLGCVGGLIRPVAMTVVEQAIALARFSRLGVGGGVYTLSERAQEAETVQCGVYRREALADAGGFDPGMPFGEDEELNFRVRQKGWRIRLNPAMSFSYRVRPSIRSLFRQYARYGRARVAVIRKHPSFFRAKHAAPAALVVGLAGGLLVAPFSGLRWLTALVWGGYFAFVAAGSTLLAVRAGFRRVDLVGLSLMALHIGYGVGSLNGVQALLTRARVRSG